MKKKNDKDHWCEISPKLCDNSCEYCNPHKNETKKTVKSIKNEKRTSK